MIATSYKDDDSDGFYDNTCNFNDARVTITDCDGNESDLTLQEFVVNATYAYTLGNDYQDEAIKALMVVLKTKKKL